MARLATPADAATYEGLWRAIRPATDAFWPGGAPQMDTRTFEALLASPGYYGYLSDDGQAALLVRPAELGEELFFWAVTPGLPPARLLALLREVFRAWLADAADRGDPYCYGELPDASPRRSKEFLDSGWIGERMTFDKPGFGRWVRWGDRASHALPRL